MKLQSLLDASWAIQLHVYTLALAFVAGTGQLFMTRKGSEIHRVLGRCFLLLMLVSALVTLLIHGRNPQNPFFGLSVLHLYVPLVVGLCALAWLGAIRHWLPLHRFAVFAMYFGSLVFTGIVQIYLVDGITHEIFFGTREVRRAAEDGALDRSMPSSARPDQGEASRRVLAAAAEDGSIEGSGARAPEHPPFADTPE